MLAERKIEFRSDGLRLVSFLGVPTSMGPEERRPAFILLRGFGSNKNGTHVQLPCAFLNELGYATLRFDIRECGGRDLRNRRG